MDYFLNTNGLSLLWSKIKSLYTSNHNSIASAQTDIDSLTTISTALSTKIGTKIDDAYVEDGYLYLTSDGEIVAGPLGPFSGGGGGGDSSSSELTLTNTTGWTSTTVSSGSECELSVNWSSTEDELPTGNGTLTITVNNARRSNISVEQGDVTVDVGEYLAAGYNTVTLTITDSTGNYKKRTFTITVVELTLTSSFDSSIAYVGEITFPYVPTGAVSKTVYFYIDNVLAGTTTTSVSRRQLTYTLPAQTHGSHVLRVYFEATINSETVQSNELYYDIICTTSGSTGVIITSQFRTTTAAQYSSLTIPYIVYNPASLTAPVTIAVNGTTVSEITVDRTEQTYTYRADDYGNLEITISSGVTTKTFELTITESEIDVEAETENLALYLSAKGRSNSEATPGTWEYEDISCTFSDFNYTSDGWQNDEDGITTLRVSGDARLTIPYQPFKDDFRGTGKTIEVEFATRDVLNYDATIISCMSGGRGLSITSQKATLKSEQSEISTQYKEDEHVRIAFVAEKRSENRLLEIYINGIMSGVVQYPDDDDFSQASPVNISIGSNYCTVDIYCIRVYDNDLTRFQIVDNWIADTQVGADMLSRYTRNNVFDEYGNIVTAKLPTELPYMIISGAELPQYKGDKKTVEITYIDPDNPGKSFTATGVQADVQGTSSQYYPRKNYKLKYKQGFLMTLTGATASTFAMNSDAIPTDVFCMKADVASSEGANNVELARLYNDSCPYSTPAQEENSKVRQGIDGFPCVIFWYNTSTSETSFIGKYNFNNDKSTEEVFGFGNDDESWEIKNNTSQRVLFKSADFSGSDWLNDYEARFPDTEPPYEDSTQLEEFSEWAASTDTTAATNANLPSPVTYGDVTYTKDTEEYRLAKFRNEAEDYMEIDSAIFYYLFTELFLMVDSRAKNAFPSFIGTEV